jgi:acetyltransferase-like isoleucine patch superfamily enzyme
MAISRSHLARLTRRSKGDLRRSAVKYLARGFLGEVAQEASLIHPATFGDPERVSVAAEAVVNDARFNTTSGSITIEPYAFLGHRVSLLTGTHDISQFGLERQRAIPPAGRDIHIEEGAWVASNATVLGPCRIGAHAVVAAGSVVIQDVPAYAVVAGAPARVVSRIDPDPGRPGDSAR